MAKMTVSSVIMLNLKSQSCPLDPTSPLHEGISRLPARERNHAISFDPSLLGHKQPSVPYRSVG